MGLKEDVKRFKKRRIPFCYNCKVDFIKIESGKYHSIWESNCECYKEKMRVSIG